MSLEKRYVFLDLENLAFLATNLHHLSMRVRSLGIEFRAYTAPDHEWADRATHVAKSNAKEAADVRMVVDASTILAKFARAEILLVTDDQFGHTLGAEEPRVSHTTWSSNVPAKWLRWLKWVDMNSLEEFFEKFGIYKERQSRPESRAGSVSRGRSASRGRSDAGSSRALSPMRDEYSYGSVSRASWSRAPRSRVGFDSLQGDEPVRRTRRQTQGRVAELESKLETEQKKAQALERHLKDANEYTQDRVRDIAGKQLQALEAQLTQTQAALEGERRLRLSRVVDERDVLAGAQFPALPQSKDRAPARAADVAASVPQPRPLMQPRRWPQGVEPSEGKLVGKVVYYNPDRGFGFILPFEGGDQMGDVFMHRSSILCDGEVNESLKHWDLEFSLGVCHKSGRPKAHAVSGPGGRYIPDLSHGQPSEIKSTPRRGNDKREYGKGEGGRGGGRGRGRVFGGATAGGKGGRGKGGGKGKGRGRAGVDVHGFHLKTQAWRTLPFI